eukprot:scaffold2268_cov188-Alexandrium_tamarense.AAC.4
MDGAIGIPPPSQLHSPTSHNLAASVTVVNIIVPKSIAMAQLLTDRSRLDIGRNSTVSSYTVEPPHDECYEVARRQLWQNSTNSS